jgi:hypothetical protein
MGVVTRCWLAGVGAGPRDLERHFFKLAEGQGWGEPQCRKKTTNIDILPQTRLMWTYKGCDYDLSSATTYTSRLTRRDPQFEAS